MMKTYDFLRATGHAPDHLRDLFLNVVGATDDLSTWWEVLEEHDLDCFYFSLDDEEQAWWEEISPRERGKWLLDMLAQCADFMPRIDAENLGLEAGSTYADGVSVLAEYLPEQG